MKKNNMDFIKDLIISILIVVVIILVCSVFFYDDLSLSKVVPESEEYLLSDTMQDDLEEAELLEETEVVTKYYIDAAELKQYEKTKEYNKGKKNPFAVESTDTTANNNITTNSTDTKKDSEESENFYEDDGTK